MKAWPFRKKNLAEVEAAAGTAGAAGTPSAMDLLLSRNCSRDEFLLLYVKLLQERFPDAKVEMTGETVVRIVNAAGKEATTFMDNAWLTYSRSASDRREILERYVSVAANLNEPPKPLLREHIVAVIKDPQFLSIGAVEKFDPVREHLCGDLWVIYAHDLPDRIQSLKPELLESAGIEMSSLRALAKENLWRIMPAAQRHGDGPWYLLTAGDYTASLLLLDGLWDELADSVDGDIVAVAPSRDVLLYTGSNSSAGLRAIREQAAQIVSGGSYVISDTLIVRSGGRWDVFKAN